MALSASAAAPASPADFVPPESHLQGPEEGTGTSRSNVEPDSHCWVPGAEPRGAGWQQDGSGVSQAASAEAGSVLPALLGVSVSSRRAVGSQVRLSWCEINVRLEVVLNPESSGMDL